MGFYNYYPNRKDCRRRYKNSDSRSVDPTCKNHGSCPYCRNNRLYQRRKEEEKLVSKLREYYDE